MKISVMHGPNLGRLGQRQPEIYGHTTLERLHHDLKMAFPSVELLFYQSNSEGALVDQLEMWQSAGVRDLVINPGALTHQSYVLRDAISGMQYRAIEVHISNIYGRESFRAHSVIAPVAVGQISGLGLMGYYLAVQYLMHPGDNMVSRD